jgi:hypothetical protein
MAPTITTDPVVPLSLGSEYRYTSPDAAETGVDPAGFIDNPATTATAAPAAAIPDNRDLGKPISTSMFSVL